MKLNFTIKLLLLLLLGVFSNIGEFLIATEILGGLFGFSDEILIIFLLTIIFFEREPYSFGVGILFCVLFIYSVLYSLIININSSNLDYFYKVLVQSFISLKFFALAAIFTNFIYTKTRKEFLFLWIVFAAVSFLGFFANIALPDAFVYSVHQYAIDRDRVVGFQFKPNDLGMFFAFMSFVPLFREKINKLDILLLICLLFGILMTTSRTALSVFVFAVIFSFFKNKKGELLLYAVFLLSFGSLFFYDRLIESYLIDETIVNFKEFLDISNSRYVRGIMVYGGFKFAIENFPFGVGAANFGTVMSFGGKYYDILGISRMDEFSDASGIFDSNIASIFGEYGIIFFAVIFYSSFFVIGGIIQKKGVALFLSFIGVFIAFSQPFYSYNVNSFNFLFFICCSKFFWDENLTRVQEVGSVTQNQPSPPSP